MTATITERVLDLVMAYMGLEAKDVTPGAHFEDDLGADSLDLVDIVMAVEREFGIAEVPNAIAEAWARPADIIQWLEARAS